MPAPAVLKVILDGTGYLKHATSFGDAEDSAREENIAELVSDAVQYDDDHDDGLSGYLQHVALLTSADTHGEGPAVQMMTVHAAKGLEFDHVFVAGLEEGRSVLHGLSSELCRTFVDHELELLELVVGERYGWRSWAGEG